MESNFINLTEKEKDKPIYRVISAKRLFELFNNKEIVLVNPKKWDDPFENFIMNSRIEFKSGIITTIGFRDNVYGQCWSRKRESDAIWRIYSPNKDGVRITTTPRKLLNALYNTTEFSPNTSSFIGKVNYYKTKELIKLLKTKGVEWIMDKSGIGIAKSLLFKRITFDYEKEVRLIFNSFGKFNSDYYSFDVNPFELIDDIVFDPNMSYTTFKKYKADLINLGYKKRIVKSTLYQIPNFILKID